MCGCSRCTCGRQWETSQSLLFLPLYGLWNWVQVIRFSWREHLPASHLVDLCLYFYEVRILKVWEFIMQCFTLYRRCFVYIFCYLLLVPLASCGSKDFERMNSPLYFLFVEGGGGQARFKLSTLNALHSWDWLWTPGSVPPEGSVHVVARFPAPSRDCVRFVVRLQGVTDLKVWDLSHHKACFKTWL